ncbi:MAG TPA: chloride channel protein [Ignavibacteriaceae bacterium]|nr:chloride channel protein [Ignavibacteriaceae bacterium]
MKKQAHLLFDTLILGIIGALGAELFRLLLDFFQTIFFDYIAKYNAPGLASEGKKLAENIGPYGLWLIPVILVIGGLISGFIVYTFAPEAEGHGTDTAVKAFHRQGGMIRKRVAPIKILASAITIGSGGAAGREGPTALFSAGFGSIYAGLLKRTDKEKRLLVLIGMAAGLSAIFRSPIGTAIFAVEVLYSDMEFETEALIYTMLGSIIAYALNAVFVGWKPLFNVPGNLAAEHFIDYAWYALLGISSGIIGTLLPNLFYYTRDLFKKIPIRDHFKPAIGALGVGLIALAYPQVLGGGYGWIQQAINGQLVFSLLFILLFGKMIAFALTVSSGGSGGVFAPTLFVGAMLGGLFAEIFHQPSAAFAIVGMAAVFGSTARVPIATLLMVTEMTGGYNLLVPAALAVIIGFYVQDFLSEKMNVKYLSLYEAQVRRQSYSQAHRMDHLKRALTILKDKKKIDPLVLGNINLFPLLDSKIPVKLTENEQLFLGTISEKNSCVNTLIKDRCLNKETEDWEIVAIIRDDEMVFPEPGERLLPDDDVLILSSKEIMDEIKKKF